MPGTPQADSTKYAGRSHESPGTVLVMKTIADLLASEDNTGCSEDLTVVDKQAVEELRELHDRWLETH